MRGAGQREKASDELRQPGLKLEEQEEMENELWKRATCGIFTLLFQSHSRSYIIEQRRCFFFLPIVWNVNEASREN